MLAREEIKDTRSAYCGDFINEAKAQKPGTTLANARKQEVLGGKAKLANTTSQGKWQVWMHSLAARSICVEGVGKLMTIRSSW